MSTDNEVCLVWLADALQELRQEGRTKAVFYLNAVFDEVVFEMKMTLVVTKRIDGAKKMGRGCLF